jgi:ribosomal-protein-alanine N-acetyltransferase
VLPEGYSLRPLSLDDAPAIAAAYDRNREHLGPWDPVRPPQFYTAEGQADAVAKQLAMIDQGLFAIWTLYGPDGEVAGRATIQNIVRGTMYGGTLGYWVDAGHLRRGLAGAMVDHLVEAGRELGLHRLEAGTRVENLPSQRVLTGRGFEQYGLVPKFLFIAGAWRDHLLFQLILHDRPLEAGG